MGQWWELAVSHRFYRTVSPNFIRSANRPRLLFILVLLVETESAEKITFVIEPADKNLNPTTETELLVVYMQPCSPPPLRFLKATPLGRIRDEV